MTIIILLALALPTWFFMLGLAECDVLRKGKLTKYTGINLMRGVEEYRAEDYYG